MDLSQVTHRNQWHGLSISQLQAIARQIREKHLQIVGTNGNDLGSIGNKLKGSRFCQYPFVQKYN